MEFKSLKELREIARLCNLHEYDSLDKSQLIDFISCSKYGKCKDLNLPSHKSDWVIYTKEGCPYCKRTKDALSKLSYKYTEIDVDETNKSKVYSVIDKYTNSYRYFPVIFMNGKFIGGYTELKDLLNIH